ncbi:MAG: hypothetical protein Crog4KO_33380 [Crocinitomicaceae bacterium]
MTYDQLFLQSSEKDLLYLLIDGHNREQLANHLGIRRDTLNKRLISIKKKFESSNIQETIVKAICIDNELKEHAQKRADSQIFQLKDRVELTLLEKTFLIELLRGKTIEDMATEFRSERKDIATLRSRVKRRLKVKTETDFVIRAISIGILHFELNCVPLQAVKNDQDALWKYFQQFINNEKQTEYMYSPVYNFHSEVKFGISPEYLQIIQLRILGHSTDDIAIMSGCTRQTIYRKIQVVKSKYKLKSAYELVMWAVNNELINLQGKIDQESITERSQFILARIKEGVRMNDIAAELRIKPASVTASIGYLKKKWRVKTLEAVLFQWLLRTSPEEFQK